VISNSSLKFQMPTRLLVYNTTCLDEMWHLQQQQQQWPHQLQQWAWEQQQQQQQQPELSNNTGFNVHKCAVTKGAGGVNFTIPRVFSGDAMNFTVSNLRTACAVVMHMNAYSSNCHCFCYCNIVTVLQLPPRPCSRTPCLWHITGVSGPAPLA